MYKYSRCTASVLIAIGLIAPHAAFSQGSEGSESGENQYGLEEIVVTARKVGESIQDIPISVQAFSSDMISNQQIVNVEDLVKFQYHPFKIESAQVFIVKNPALCIR